jgi:L-arabinose isomerase
MKEIELLFQGAEFEPVEDGIKVKGYVDLEQLVNSLTAKEIEENVHEYEKLFLLMKDYYRKVEKRDENFFK